MHFRSCIETPGVSMDLSLRIRNEHELGGYLHDGSNTLLQTHSFKHFQTASSMMPKVYLLVFH